MLKIRRPLGRLIFNMGIAIYLVRPSFLLRRPSGVLTPWLPLQWRHNGHDCVSNHRRLDCLLNRLFWHRSKKIWKLRVTGLWGGNSQVTSEFPAQRASNAEYVSIWWRHHFQKPAPSQRLEIVVNANIFFLPKFNTWGVKFVIPRWTLSMFNSSRPGDAYVRHWTGPSLI